MPKRLILDGIQYLGLAGITQVCVEAVEMLLQFKRDLVQARLLTSEGQHGYLLWDSVGNAYAIQTGFSSGYAGEGPGGLSYTLAQIENHGIDLDEVEVSESLMKQLERCNLRYSQSEAIKVGVVVRPTRFWDYFLERDNHAQNGRVGAWKNIAPVLPFGVIDHRLADLVVGFWNGPDKALLSAYRRLESRVRARTGLDEHGAKLFSQAFAPKGGKLMWSGIDEGEAAGRMNLFTGTFQAFRNPRAHHETDREINADVLEFLLVNQLFHLEEIAIESPEK